MIRVVHPGSGFFTHPGSGGQKHTGSRIRIRNTVCHSFFLSPVTMFPLSTHSLRLTLTLSVLAFFFRSLTPFLSFRTFSVTFPGLLFLSSLPFSAPFPYAHFFCLTHSFFFDCLSFFLYFLTFSVLSLSVVSHSFCPFLQVFSSHSYCVLIHSPVFSPMHYFLSRLFLHFLSFILILFLLFSSHSVMSHCSLSFSLSFCSLILRPLPFVLFLLAISVILVFLFFHTLSVFTNFLIPLSLSASITLALALFTLILSIL